MMINKIASVSIYVDDQDAAVDFWTKKIGFQVVKDTQMGPQFRWLEVAPKGAETVLVLFSKAAMPNHNEMKPSLVFNCDDVDKVYEELKNKGVTFEGQPQNMGFGKFVSFFDESGNQFGLKS